MPMISEMGSRVLAYLQEKSCQGLTPSVREICEDLGIRSTSTAHKYVKELEKAGYLQLRPGARRNILMKTGKVVRVPLVGMVTAGVPILAVEAIEGYIPIEEEGAAGEELFALRVRGESMINAGILSGDIIIVQHTVAAENGDIVVALIEDEATVKRFYKENGHYRLQPENDAMSPILVDEVSILGKVIRLVRNY